MSWAFSSHSFHITDVQRHNFASLQLLVQLDGKSTLAFLFKAHYLRYLYILYYSHPSRNPFYKSFLCQLLFHEQLNFSFSPATSVTSGLLGAFSILFCAYNCTRRYYNTCKVKLTENHQRKVLFYILEG